MKHKLLISTLILSITSLFVWNIILHHKESLLSKNEEVRTYELAKLSYENQKLHSNLFYFRVGALEKLNEPSVINTVGQINFKEPSRKLVFRFASTHCNLCYEGELRLLNQQLNFIAPEEIIILTSFPERHFRGLKSKFQRIYPQANIINTQTTISLAQDRFHEPYYFILEKDSTTHSFFFPDKALPTLSNEYFNFIKKVFKEKP